MENNLRVENNLPPKIMTPANVLGNRRGGPSSTPSDEEGFTYGAVRTSKGVTSGSFKESERTTPAGAPASACKYSPACLAVRKAWRRSHPRLRRNIGHALRG